MTGPQDRYRRYLETLSAQTLVSIGDFVTQDVHFKDPFNDVRGIDAMQRVFRHMFENVDDIRFNVGNIAMDGHVCLMNWCFEGHLGGKAWSFNGASVVTFNPDGLVAEHIDHWDAGRDFYERLPIIGWLLAWVRGRLSVR
jgi:steroid Delta-isomerase